jgi:hypothetical protein
MQRELQRAGRMRIDSVGRSPAQGAHRLDRRLRVGQRVTDRLVFDDWDRPAAPSVRAKVSAASKAARIRPTANMPTIGAVPVKQASTKPLPPPTEPMTLSADVRTPSSRNSGSRCARWPMESMARSSMTPGAGPVTAITEIAGLPNRLGDQHGAWQDGRNL